MKMTKRDQILLAVIGAIAVVGGFYWFVVKPAKADLSAQKDELAQIEQETNALRGHPLAGRVADQGQRPSWRPSGSAWPRRCPRTSRRPASWCSSSAWPTGPTWS